jgi:hypothetical protein
MAILNLVFGGLNLICVCLGIVGTAAMMGMAGANNPMADMDAVLQREVPGYRAIEIGRLVVGLVLTLVLLAAGIGLLNMQTWARWASVAWAILVILFQGAVLVYVLVLLNPAMEKATQEMTKKQGQAAPPTSPAESAGRAVGSICAGSVFIIYAFALLIVMFLPNVSAAFAGHPIRRKRQFDDEDLGDFGPRRRRVEDEY